MSTWETYIQKKNSMGEDMYTHLKFDAIIQLSSLLLHKPVKLNKIVNRNALILQFEFYSNIILARLAGLFYFY